MYQMGSPDTPRERGKFWVNIWHSVMYPENAASAMQKCLNQLACHLDSEWGGQRNCVLDGQLDVDIVPPGKYS